MQLVVLLVILGLAGLLTVIGKWQLARSYRNFPPVGKFIEVESVRLHYVERGTGVPVVMIHGSDGILQDFTQTIFDSVADEFHAIAVDRPGHGYSGRPLDEPVTLAMTARLIHLAVSRLVGGKPIIVGHSYGGAVALQYAVDYPDDVAALVLLAPGAYPDGMPNLAPGTKVMPWLGPLLARPMFVPIALALGRGIVGRSYRPNPPSRAYADTLRQYSARPEQFRTVADEVVHFKSSLDAITGLYKGIQNPAVIVAGDSDLITLPDRTARRLALDLPNAQLIILPGTGHMVHHVHREEVIKVLRVLGTKLNRTA